MTKSELFRLAHRVTRATIKAGDDYRVTFGAALRYITTLRHIRTTSTGAVLSVNCAGTVHVNGVWHHAPVVLADGCGLIHGRDGVKYGIKPEELVMIEQHTAAYRAAARAEAAARKAWNDFYNEGGEGYIPSVA